MQASCKQNLVQRGVNLDKPIAKWAKVRAQAKFRLCSSVKKSHNLKPSFPSFFSPNTNSIQLYTSRTVSRHSPLNQTLTVFLCRKALRHTLPPQSQLNSISPPRPSGIRVIYKILHSALLTLLFFLFHYTTDPPL